jgi:hypothetical protein
MTPTKLLIGSLSNDLYRVATLSHRGSLAGATSFFKEAQRWCVELKRHELKPYIQAIVTEITHTPNSTFSAAQAEQLLMYSVLLQNYSLHLE